MRPPSTRRRDPRGRAVGLTDPKWFTIVYIVFRSWHSCGLRRFRSVLEPEGDTDPFFYCPRTCMGPGPATRRVRWRPDSLGMLAPAL